MPPFSRNRRTETSKEDKLVISQPYDGHRENDPAIDEETRAFVNKHASSFAVELAEAQHVGVHRALAGTAEFNALMSQRVPIKWVVTIFNELWAVPETAGRQEIAHSVASNNERCFTGGVGEWPLDGQPLITLNNWTGHYTVSQGSFHRYGTPAWGKAGIPYKVGDLIG